MHHNKSLFLSLLTVLSVSACSTFNSQPMSTLGTGGTLLRNLDKLLIQEVGLPVIIADDPTTCVIRGMGLALSYLDNSAYDSLFVRVI